MTWLSDRTVDHLRRVIDWPDLSATRYRAIEPIGRGGMGAVYLVEDTQLQRRVALKVLRDPDVDPDAVARMLREARISARLEHPGIVPIHDVGRLPDGRSFYVMKHVRGKRLDEWAAVERPLTEVLSVFQRICETVAFAHAHGVLHRDLKPQNIMLGEYGEVLVLDWGVAKLLGTATGPEPGEPTAGASTTDGAAGSDSIDAAGPTAASDAAPAALADTQHGAVLGTLAWMAPEQARGDVARVDQRSDVYALGAILGYLLTRRPPQPGPPHTGSTATAAKLAGPSPAAAHSPAAIPEPRVRASAVPRRLAAICARAMSPDPDQRYPTADALRADVAAFLAGQPVSAYREPLWERAGRMLVHYRVAVLLVAMYLVMRMAFAFWQAAQRTDPGS